MEQVERALSAQLLLEPRGELAQMAHLVGARLRVREGEGRGGGARPRGQPVHLLHAVGRLEGLWRRVAAAEDLVLFA